MLCAQLAEFVHDVIDALKVGFGLAGIVGAQLVSNVEIDLRSSHMGTVFVGLDGVIDKIPESNRSGDAQLHRGSGPHHDQCPLLTVLVHYPPHKEIEDNLTEGSPEGPWKEAGDPEGPPA